MTLPPLVRIGAVACLTVSMGLVAAPPGPGLVPADSATATSEAARIDGRIVFDDFQTGQIYTVNPDGTALMQVTRLHGDHIAFDPQWGPNSHRIVYVSNKTGNFRLHLMRTSGTHDHLLAPDRQGYQDFTPTFMPGGRTVVYTRCQPDPPGGCALYSIRVDGTGRHALTRYRSGAQQGADFLPDVSPNGHRIAFSRFDSGGLLSQIWVMHSDGTHRHPITAPRLEGLAAAWTPTGRHLLFMSNGAHPGSSIYQIRPDGSQLTRLTAPRWPNNDTVPASSPRGDRIAFSSDRTHPDLCCRELYIMNADGTREHRVATGLHGVSRSDWGTAPALPAAVHPSPSAKPTRARLHAIKAAERQARPWASAPTRH
jgi:Tol biopolymer transport system component